MKPQNLKMFSIVFCLLLGFIACKKENAPIPPTPPEPPTPADTAVVNFFQDQLSVWSELNELMVIANKAIQASDIMSGDAAVPFDVCGASVQFDYNGGASSATVTFNGSSCSGAYTRSGYLVVYIQTGEQWKNAGSQVLLGLDNLQVTRNADGKSISLNGLMNVQKAGDGLLKDIATGLTLSNTIEPVDLHVQYDDGVERSINGTRYLQFTYENELVIEVGGLSTYNNENNVMVHGQDRHGNTYFVKVNSPVICRESCGFRFGAGEVKYQVNDLNGVATFGVNEEGTPSACPGSGTYYFKAEWQRSADSPALEAVIPYTY